ncbi:MAG: hypothetical protein ACI9HY_002991 [Planctomycetaceae bacterium]|jgi:hypothetical protein
MASTHPLANSSLSLAEGLPIAEGSSPIAEGSSPIAEGSSQLSSAKQNALNTLMKSQHIWRASGIQEQVSGSGTPTGYKSLDTLLVDDGWPNQGLTEVLHDQPGVGELRLLAPALASLSQTQNRWLLWIAPPYIPYAPALSRAGIDLSRLLIVNPDHQADRLWVLEKALASNSCSAVMAWPGQLNHKQLRRLQVASKTGHCLGVLYRHSRVADQPSPAELRLRLFSKAGTSSALNDRSQLNLQILKRKGGWATNIFQLELNDNLNQSTPDFSKLQVQQWQQGKPDLVYMDQPVEGVGHALQ